MTIRPHASWSLVTLVLFTLVACTGFTSLFVSACGPVYRLTHEPIKVTPAATATVRGQLPHLTPTAAANNGYPAYPTPSHRVGYPAPAPTIIPLLTPASRPTTAPTVTPAPNAISPANAAALRASTRVAPPSFDDIDQIWGDPGYAGYFPMYPILDIAFSADGAQLAIAKAHGVYVYDLQGLKAQRFIDTGNVVPHHVFFMANSRILMVCDDLFYWPRGATFLDIHSGQRVGMIRVPRPAKEPMETMAQLSPDGQTLVIQTGNYASLYDAVSRQLSPFWPRWFQLTSYAFSPDGKLLAAGFGGVTVWEVATGRALFDAADRRNSLTLSPPVAFSADGRLLATMDGPKLVVWNVAQKQRVLDAPIENLLYASRAAFAPDGSSVALVASHVVTIWRMPSGTLAFQAPGADVTFSPDSAAAAVSSENNVAIWDLATGQKRFDLAGSTSQFAPDGRLLIKVAADRYSFVDTTKGQVQAAFSAQRPRFAADGRLVDIQDDAAVRMLDTYGQATAKLTVQATPSPMTSLAFLSDGRLVMGFANSTIRLQPPVGELLINTIGSQEQGAWVYQVAVASNGQTFAAASKDGTIAYLDAGSYRNTVLWPGQNLFGGPPGELTSVAFSPDGQRIAAGSSEGTVKLWDTSAFVVTPTQVLKGHTNWVWSVAFSPDGRQLASASADEKLRIWDLASGTTVHTLSGHLGAVHSVAYAPNGKLLASGDWAGTVKLWNPATGDLVRTLSTPGTQVNQVAFSRDGQVIAAGLGDGTVRIWETTTGQELTTLHAEGGSVWGIAFSADGSRLAAALNDGSAQIWEAP